MHLVNLLSRMQDFGSHDNIVQRPLIVCVPSVHFLLYSSQEALWHTEADSATTHSERLTEIACCV